MGHSLCRGMPARIREEPDTGEPPKPTPGQGGRGEAPESRAGRFQKRAQYGNTSSHSRAPPTGGEPRSFRFSSRGQSAPRPLPWVPSNFRRFRNLRRRSCAGRRIRSSNPPTRSTGRPKGQGSGKGAGSSPRVERFPDAIHSSSGKYSVPGGVAPTRMRIFMSVVAAAGFLAGVGCGDGHDHSKRNHGTAQAAQTAEKAKNPVCGMTIDKPTAKADERYKGEHYYFCSQVSLEVQGRSGQVREVT